MLTETKSISEYDDMIDVRDVIARVEELEQARDDYQERDLTEPLTESWAQANEEDAEELQRLTALLEDLAGNGGDEQWRGAWYPIMLIRDSYFEDYARDEAEQLGLIDNNAKWPYTCIDWKRASEELQQDYSTTDFDGVDYHYR